MHRDTTVLKEAKPEAILQPAPTTPSGWLMFAIGKWGIGGACLVLATGALYYVYGDLRSTTKQMLQDQKEQNLANLRVVLENTEAITKTGEAIGEVGEAVEASKKATEEIARDVRELREDLRREK